MNKILDKQIRFFILLFASLMLILWGAVSRAQDQESLSLQKVVSLALQNSRAVAMARAQYAVSKAEAGVDRSTFLPNLFTGSGAAYTYGFPTTPGGAPPSVFNLAYTQSIYNPPARGELHAAEKRAENQRLELEKTRDSVMVEAASDYLELAEVRHSLMLLQTERTSEQHIRDVTQERVAAGLELPIDITRMDLSLARVEEHIVKLQGREEILSDGLHDLTGIPSEQTLEVTPADLSSNAESSSEDLVNQALAFSPDVKEAENERAAQTDLLKGERGGYWPTVDFVGTYNVLSRINNYDQFYNSFQRNNVNVGIQLTIPIFNARTHANVALASTQLTTAELAEGQKRHQVATETKEQIRGLRETDASREVARLDLKLAQESLANMQSQYDQGRATLRDLEQAKVAENEKWLAYLDADLARQKAQLALWQSTGELAQHLQ